MRFHGRADRYRRHEAREQPVPPGRWRSWSLNDAARCDDLNELAIQLLVVRIALAAGHLGGERFGRTTCSIAACARSIRALLPCHHSWICEALRCPASRVLPPTAPVARWSEHRARAARNDARDHRTKPVRVGRPACHTEAVTARPLAAFPARLDLNSRPQLEVLLRQPAVALRQAGTITVAGAECRLWPDR